MTDFEKKKIEASVEVSKVPPKMPLRLLWFYKYLKKTKNFKYDYKFFFAVINARFERSKAELTYINLDYTRLAQKIENKIKIIFKL